MTQDSATALSVLPVLRSGRIWPAAAGSEAWIIVAWLIGAECRSYIEDLDGGDEQPDMQQVAKLRLLEQLVEIDQRVGGAMPTADGHRLALALEYGMRDLVQASGPELVEVFGLGEELGGGSCRLDAVFTLWTRLLDAFPGEPPDRLVAAGQRDVLQSLRAWTRLAETAGVDIGFMVPFLKDA